MCPSADSVYRKCLANGTWALKGNYSMCKAILHEEVSDVSLRLLNVCLRSQSLASAARHFHLRAALLCTCDVLIGTEHADPNRAAFATNMPRGGKLRPE